MAYETFSPEDNGWKLQRGYQIVPRFLVVSDQRELGNVTSVAVASKAIRQLTGLRYRAFTRDASEYWQSFFGRLAGPAARFYYAWPEFVSTPDKAPALSAVVSGNQASRTIYAMFAWKNSAGVTKASPASSLLVPVNNLLKVTLPTYPPSITQAVIYATEGSAGTEQEQTILTLVQTWTQPNAALLTGTSSIPAANSARETPLCRLPDPESFSIQRGDGTTYEASLTLEETYV